MNRDASAPRDGSLAQPLSRVGHSLAIQRKRFRPGGSLIGHDEREVLHANAHPKGLRNGHDAAEHAAEGLHPFEVGMAVVRLSRQPRDASGIGQLRGMMQLSPRVGEGRSHRR